MGKFEDQVNDAHLALPLELQGVFTPGIEKVGCQIKSKQKKILLKKLIGWTRNIAAAGTRRVTA